MSMREAPVANLLGGVALGALLAGLVAVALWPDSEHADAGSHPVSTAPTVPPPRTVDVPSTAPATSSGTGDDDVPDAGTDAGTNPDDEPSAAALLPDAAPAGEGRLPDASEVTCPPATVEVADAAGLDEALAGAGPGESIWLADGTYGGRFRTELSGTPDNPLWLCGSADAVLDGGDPEEDGYTLHLDGASYWRLVGFSVTGGQKGVMTDGSVGSVIQGLTVTGTGDEAIHLRSFSTDNVVLDNLISGTGNRRDDYGEGVYVGSAVSNWCTYTACEADRSDRNVIKGNTITDTPSEAVDIKEGTTGGVIVGNVFDGSAMTAADTWVNLKGNNYLVQGNHGTAASDNGFETHDILPGWGDFNVFDANTGVVSGSGWGIASWPAGSNVVRCSNRLTQAAEGLSNIPCA
jgi:hypothetical protein